MLRHWKTKLISNLHQSISLRLKCLPASTTWIPFSHNPCLRHVLVIIKHNNGFYKSAFASLVTWIIQPKREKKSEEGRGGLLQSGRPYTWDGRRWGILSELFIWFYSSFYICHIVFSPFSTPHPHTHTHTHTETLQTVTFISSSVNYGCTSC